ncbi:thiamine phosphate synthase [Metabacillus litoralis]|uniref:thiamine phosphate synthase n=1 Tax=Metabacillus litoralis TaxID=152268 RepID=UPI0020422F24|nr:thiamine phosphate synthase [Metabacillus litoralis]
MKKLEIHIITDGKQPVGELTKRILMIHEEADYIHIREKKKSASEIMEIVSILISNGVSKSKLVINDRLDVALVNQLPNIHLPGHSFSVGKVRELEPSLRIGRSVHSLSEALESEKDGADYLLFGHVFETNSKANLTPRGIKQLAEICQSVQIPVIAIGGIVPNTISKLPGVNVSGIAVMSYVIASEDPHHALLEIKDSLSKGGFDEKTF